MVPVVMILRVYAMYSRSQTILGILLVIYIVEIIIIIIAAAIYSQPGAMSGMYIVVVFEWVVPIPPQ